MTEEKMNELCDKIETVLGESRLTVADCLDVLKILIVSQIVTQAADRGFSRSVAVAAVANIGSEMVLSTEKAYDAAIQPSDSQPDNGQEPASV